MKPLFQLSYYFQHKWVWVWWVSSTSTISVMVWFSWRVSPLSLPSRFPVGGDQDWDAHSRWGHSKVKPQKNMINGFVFKLYWTPKCTDFLQPDFMLRTRQSALLVTLRSGQSLIYELQTVHPHVVLAVTVSGPRVRLKVNALKPVKVKCICHFSETRITWSMPFLGWSCFGYREVLLSPSECLLSTSI